MRTNSEHCLHEGIRPAISLHGKTVDLIGRGGLTRDLKYAKSGELRAQILEQIGVRYPG